MTTVAIVEDNEALRRMLVELISRQEDHRCVCACSTSREALLEVPKHHPDVVLMGLQLPDESGIVCTARLVGQMPGLQVIVVTVRKEAEIVFQALKAGAGGYILKPFRPGEIIQAIAEVRAGGAPMTGEIARMVVRSFREPSVTPEPNGLTIREAEILTLLAQGMTNKEIAQRVNISPGTVRIHLGNMFKKLHVRSRTEAAANYFRAKQGGPVSAGEKHLASG